MEMIEVFKKLLPESRKKLPFKNFDIDVFKEDEQRCGIIIRGVIGNIRAITLDHFDVGTYDFAGQRVMKIRSLAESEDQFRIFGYLVEFILLDLSKSRKPISKDVLSSIKKWQEFSNATKKTISRRKQIGLIGELFFLRNLMELMPEVDHLTGWTGPNGYPVDFLFGDTFGVDVKSRLQPFRDWLTISSVNQLDNGLSTLHLVVFDFTPTDVGVDLKQLVVDVKSRFETIDEEHVFLELLSKVGYNHYDNYSNLVKVEYFGSFVLNARDRGFPILAKPNDVRIDKVKYEINILDLERLNPEVTFSMIRSRLE